MANEEDLNKQRGVLIQQDIKNRKESSKQAQADLKQRLAFHKQDKQNKKDAEKEALAAQKILDDQAEAAQKVRLEKEEAAVEKLAKEERDAVVKKRQDGIKHDAAQRALHDRSFEDRQGKQDARLNRRLDLEEARDKEGSVRNLADKMSEGKSGAVDDANNANLAAKLRDMNAFTNLDANEASVSMSTKFNELVSITQDVENTSEDERRIAQLSLDELSTAANDEEERREKQNEADEMMSLWGRMEQSSDRAADNLEGMRNNLLKGGGIVAVLGTLAMLFLDPETLFEMIKTGMEIVRNIIQGISDFLNGDMTTKLSMVKENFGSIALAVGALTLIFLPNILRGVVRLKNILSGVGKFLGVMKKGFMLLRAAIFGAATANATAGGGVLAMFSAALIPLAPVIAIGLAIAAAIGIFAFLMTKLRDSLGFSSVFDLIWVGVGYVKDAIAAFGNMYIKIANSVMAFVEKIASWFGFEIEMPQMELMATNNAELAKQEARQKKLAIDEEKEKEVEAKAKEEAEAEALLAGPDITAELEVVGPSEAELEKQKDQDAFRAMMGFDAIDRAPLVAQLSPPAATGISGIPGVETGEAMAQSSAANAKAQANAAGRPDTQPPSSPPVIAVGGSSSSSTTFNTLATNASRVSRLNIANQ